MTMTAAVKISYGTVMGGNLKGKNCGANAYVLPFPLLLSTSYLHSTLCFMQDEHVGNVPEHARFFSLQNLQA